MVKEGLRACEVARVQIGDIDVDERTMLVTGKGGHQRALPIVGEAWDAMRRGISRSAARAPAT